MVRGRNTAMGGFCPRGRMRGGAEKVLTKLTFDSRGAVSEALIRVYLGNHKSGVEAALLMARAEVKKEGMAH